MKRIYVLLIIIFILFGMLLMKINNNNKQPEYSLRDIQAILDKSDNIKNYECEINGDIYKIKDNKLYIESTTGTKHIRDYEEKTVITYNESSKYYMENKLDDDLILSTNIYAGLGNNSISGVNIISIKEEKYNGNQCLKLEIKEEKQIWTFWINIQNGLVMKTKYPDGNIRKFEYKFNTVTDADVNPDLTGYRKIINLES